MKPGGQSNSWPIKFTLENHPGSHVLVSYEGSIVQTCGINNGFNVDQGLQIYFAVARSGDNAAIYSFKIEYSFDLTYGPTTDPTSDPTTDPTNNPTPSPTANPTPAPTDNPTPSPTDSPTPAPTTNPTTDPTADPTLDPTSDPTTDPTKEPTKPTQSPTAAPSNSPTAATSNPTTNPTIDPTVDPTNDPTTDPTNDPTYDPTTDPTDDPTIDPTIDPTNDPTIDPTVDPTMDPTTDPTNDPTTDPTIDPTNDPTVDPTRDPTKDPTTDPTNDPTTDPTIDPTHDPTTDPTNDPTKDPTVDPTIDPTKDPTNDPTRDPTIDPTHDPTTDPTTDPTRAPSQPPTNAPTQNPTISPSFSPTLSPTLAPTRAPTFSPSMAPSTAPTVIGRSKWVELFMYYDMTEGLQNIILSVFNDKLSYATYLGIKYGTFQNDYEEYKFIYEAYTCVAFTVSSFDRKSPLWKDDLFDCDEYQEELQKKQTDQLDKYKPETKGAKYLGVIKILLTGDDEQDSIKRIGELKDLLSNNNDTNTTETRRRLGNNADFIEYTENCMKTNETLEAQLDSDETCTGYLGLDLEYFKIITLDIKLQTAELEIQRVVTIAEKFVQALKYIIYVFIAICLCVSILGKMYAKRIGSDNVKAFGILFFSLYTWDFYSDIMFCVRLGDAAEWVLFAVSVMFIFIPWIMNLIQLFQAQRKWTTDKSIQEGVRGWFIDWSIILMVAVGVSGNSFGAIELANSNLFGADLFSMGLSPRHLKEFQSKRFYSSVLLENIPQLIVQIYFLSILGEFDEPTFVALLSSSISVVLSIVDIWGAKKLVTVMDDTKNDGINLNTIEFTILSNDEIKEKKQILLTKPRALAKAIAETLIVDSRTVEIYQLLAAEKGIKVGFTVYSVDYDIEQMLNDLLEEQTKLKLLITNYWEIKQYPTLSEIHRGKVIRITNDDEDEDGIDEEYSIGNNWHRVNTRTKGNSINALHPNSGEIKQRGHGFSISGNKTDHHIPLSRMRTMMRKQMKAKDPEILKHKNTFDDGLKNDSLNGTEMVPILQNKDTSESKSCGTETNSDFEDTDAIDPQSQWKKYMNKLQKYAKSQTKVYESHPISKENPVTVTFDGVDDVNDEEKDTQKLWISYSKNIQNLLESRLELQSKHNKEQNTADLSTNNSELKWKKLMENMEKHYLQNVDKQAIETMDDDTNSTENDDFQD